MLPFIFRKEMPMAKCAYCKKEIKTTEPIQKKGNQKFHVKCYKVMIEERYEKSDDEIQDKQILIEYINILYDRKETNPKTISQIDKYHLEFEIPYRHMLLTLKYFYEIKDNKVEQKYGIGIIPHVLEEAKEYYMSVQRSLETNEKKDVLKSVKPKKAKYTETPKEISLIDIENL